MDYEIENIELRNALKLAHARIKELEADEVKLWSGDIRILKNFKENLELKERIKELEAQVN